MENTKCQRVKDVLVETKLTAEPPSHVGRYCRTPKARGDEMRAWVREFNDFIRDHRSQDAVVLGVEDVTVDLCSACNREWETFEEGGKKLCAHCGAEVDTQN